MAIFCSCMAVFGACGSAYAFYIVRLQRYIHPEYHFSDKITPYADGLC